MKPKVQSLLEKIRHPNNRWRLYLLLGIFLYFVVINQFIHIRPDHAFLALVILSLAMGKKKSKQFLIDWAPFVGFWIAYDMMRGVADSVRHVINVVGPFKLELLLFGPLFKGQIPSFFFEHFQAVHPNALGKVLLDIMGANFYTLHFGAPLILGWIFWHTTNDRRTFYHFIWTLTVLNVMALTTFMLYPAAPPWYVYKYGLIQPVGVTVGSAGNLVNFDKLIGTKFLQSFWDTFNPNLFAAIPSLHGSYPCVIAFFGMKKFRKVRPLWLLYPAGVWFSAVYLNEHYIIDLIIGLIYVIVAYQVVKRILYPLVFRRFVEKKSAKKTESQPVTSRRRRSVDASPASASRRRQSDSRR